MGPRGKSGLLQCSPANCDPDEPGDAHPTDLELAICIDRIETFSKCKVNQIKAKWAGLRCHSKDSNFIIGNDPNDSTNSFFWCSGLAGQGVQAAPGYSQVLANMVCGQSIPAHIVDMGFNVEPLLPHRFVQREAC